MKTNEVGRCPWCHGPLESEQVGTGRQGHGAPVGWCSICKLVVLSPHLVPEPTAPADLA